MTSSRFTPSFYPGGGYLKVHAQVGSLIDWVGRVLPPPPAPLCLTRLFPSASTMSNFTTVSAPGVPFLPRFSRQTGSRADVTYPRTPARGTRHAALQRASPSTPPARAC